MTKQVIIIRTDLKMRRGKEIAQGAHASMAWLSNAVKKSIESGQNIVNFMTKTQQEWIEGNFKKICLQVNSEKDLLDLHARADAAGLTVSLIVDSGLTEFAGIPTNTAIAIGPDNDAEIDKITGTLKLY